MSKETVLVTGSSGFIGGALVRYLQESGRFEPIQLIRKSSTPKSSQVDSIMINSFAEEDISNAIGGRNIDYVVHLAAAGVGTKKKQVHEIIDGNINYTVNLMSAFKGLGLKKFVTIGSCFEYGLPKHNNLLTEENQLAPTSLYGAGKLSSSVFASSLAREWNIPHAHLRFFGVYGVGESDARLLPYVIQCLLKNEIVDLTSGEQVRDLTYVSDIVNAIVAVFDNGEGEYNVCSSQGTAIKDVVKLACEYCERPIRLLNFGAKPSRKEEPQFLVGDPSKFFKDTGWKPRLTIEQGIEKMVQYYREKMEK